MRTEIVDFWGMGDGWSSPPSRKLLCTVERCPKAALSLLCAEHRKERLKARS